MREIPVLEFKLSCIYTVCKGIFRLYLYALPSNESNFFHIYLGNQCCIGIIAFYVHSAMLVLCVLCGCLNGLGHVWTMLYCIHYSCCDIALLLNPSKGCRILQSVSVCLSVSQSVNLLHILNPHDFNASSILLMGTEALCFWVVHLCVLVMSLAVQVFSDRLAINFCFVHVACCHDSVV